jgi:hypothetical protein
VDIAQRESRSAFWRHVGAFLMIWAVYTLLHSGETVADTLMSSVFIPVLAQGYGVDLSHIQVGIDLLREQPFYYWQVPSVGMIGMYPIGMTLLVAPLQALFWWIASGLGMEVSVLSPDFAQTRYLLEKLTASSVAALAAVFVYKSLLVVVSRRTAILFATLYTLGSNSLSLLAQGLWQQAGVNLLTSVILYLVLSRRARPSTLQEVLFFSAVGFLFSIRPTAIIWSVAFIVLYWRLFGRPYRVSILAALLAVVPALAWNILIFEHPLGGYAVTRVVNFDWNVSEWLYRAILILFSLQKGLLIFNPLVFGIFFVWLFREQLESRLKLLMIALLLAELCSLALCATNPNWHGGRGFGPRYVVDSLGVMTVLSALAFHHAKERWPRSMTAACLLVSLYSIPLHIYGAVGASLPIQALVDLHQRLLMP